MQIVDAPVKRTLLENMAKKRFGNLVKAVVDIETRRMAIDAELHADEEALLLTKGSAQHHLWGINLYPEYFGTKNFIEYDSMINLRPTQHNGSRGVDSPVIRKKITAIVKKLIT